MSTITPTTSTSGVPTTSQPTSPPTSHPQSAKSGAQSDTSKFLRNPSRVALAVVSQDAERRFAIKCAAIVIGALIEIWLLVSAMNDPKAFYVFASIVWLVFGGYRNYVADEVAPPAVIPEQVRLPDSHQHTSPEEVESWLVKLLPTSSFLVAPSFLRLELEVLRSDKIEKAEAQEAAKDLEVKQAFKDLCGLVDLYDHDEDRMDTSLKEITGPVSPISSQQGVPESDLGTSRSITSDDMLIEPQRANIMKQTPPKEGASASKLLLVAKAMEKWVDLLKVEHELPKFIDKNLVKVLWDQHKNRVGEIIYCVKTDDGDSDIDSEFSLVRSVMGDSMDLSFMLEMLQGWVPKDVIQQIKELSLATVSRYRHRLTGLNPWIVALSLHWYRKYSPPGSINSWGDVMRAERARVRRYRPQCPPDHRYSCGLNSECRPYLTEIEEETMNAGISEYNEYSGTGEPSQLQLQLQARPQVELSCDSSTVPAWLDSMDEFKVLDPHAYGPCDCGKMAMVAVLEYRYEKEHGYRSMTQSRLEFPLQFMSSRALCELSAARKQGESSMGDEQFLPRSQEVLQICDQHALVSNNLFVLIDTSVDDANMRISNPGGLLPAPGLGWRSAYPEGFQTKPRSLKIPYDQLAPRCIHGQPFTGMGSCCPAMFSALANAPRVSRNTAPRQSVHTGAQ
jgi:hypothetical protein